MSARSERLVPLVRSRSVPATPLARSARALILLLLAAYFLLPLYWLLVNAPKDNAQLFNTFGLGFARPGHLWENLRALFAYQDGIFTRWLLNSFVYAAASAVLATASSAMAGYAFAKYDFPGKNALFTLILGAIMVPSTALVLPIYLLINRLGLANTYWGVILPSMVSPFGLYLMRIFWQQACPTELIEAARIDGANDRHIFWSIGLPLVRGGLTTVALISFVGVWNNFFLPLVVVSRDDLYPVTLGLSVLNTSAAAQANRLPMYGMILVGSIISVAPLLAAFFSLRRYWAGGLTVGATKG